MKSQTVKNEVYSDLPPDVVASSDEMRELVSVVHAIAPTQITVLLTGESGTGKEVFARLIHDWSARRNGAFVTVNCGAIPEGLIESELFGHEKGSFTGATADRKGFFEVAAGGTIFLDEIGEMPLAAQVKLLRVLETGKFTRVGSTQERTTDARVVAATNRDLESEVRGGRFRADLYYRLRAVMLRLPPLRNRREDIPLLVDRILLSLVKRHSLPHRPHIESGAIERLTNAEWRGNIRELKNTLEQLAVLSFAPHESGLNGIITSDDVDSVLDRNAALGWSTDPLYGKQLPVITSKTDASSVSELALIYRALLELRNDLDDIKEALQIRKPHNDGAIVLPENSEIRHVSDLDLSAREHELIREALARFHGDRDKAAEALGISKRTLYRKLKEGEVE